MMQEQARKVIKILLTADGGCEYCVASLLKLFCKEFPEHKELSEELFAKSFGKKLFLEERSQPEETPNKKKERYRLHGWDDEKIYFWDEEKGKEYSVTDEKHLYERLLRICIEYFKRKDKEK